MKHNISFLIIFIFWCPFLMHSQDNRTFLIRNCDSIRQIATYSMNVISPISMAVMNAQNINANKTIKFSKSSNLNLDSLSKKINKVKDLLPARFIANLMGSFWYDNKPEENDKIWFLQLYAKEESKGKYTPYLAFKVTFEGSDAMKERLDPKVLNVEFITDKNALQKLIARLKVLPEVH